METAIREILKKHKKKKISLLELQQQLPGESDERAFFQSISQLEKKQILVPSKSASTYQINKQLLNQDKMNQILQAQLLLKSDIKLEAYLSLPEEVWERDKSYIFLVDKYFMQTSRVAMTIPECAYHLTGNEKWIDEEGGREILQRLGVWDRLNLVSYNDPLMLAINRKQFHASKKHLIVENKSVFYRILEVIDRLPIASLIFGAGWRITSGIETLRLQLGIRDDEKEEHRFYYFGDLDWEGIAIWQSVSEQVVLAASFYRGLLQYDFSKGKETQSQNESALKEFLSHFTKEEQERIQYHLLRAGYIPQEALTSKQLLDRGGRL